MLMARTDWERIAYRKLNIIFHIACHKEKKCIKHTNMASVVI